jgi:hypothetical protein
MKINDVVFRRFRHVHQSERVRGTVQPGHGPRRGNPPKTPTRPRPGFARWPQALPPARCITPRPWTPAPHLARRGEPGGQIDDNSLLLYKAAPVLMATVPRVSMCQLKTGIYARGRGALTAVRTIDARSRATFRDGVADMGRPSAAGATRTGGEPDDAPLPQAEVRTAPMMEAFR